MAENRQTWQNQLEKLEAAKAALLVCLGLLSPSRSIFTDLTRSFLALLGPTGPYFALLCLT